HRPALAGFLEDRLDEVTALVARPGCAEQGGHARDEMARVGEADRLLARRLGGSIDVEWTRRIVFDPRRVGREPAVLGRGLVSGEYEIGADIDGAGARSGGSARDEQRTNGVDEVGLVGIVLASVHPVKGGGVDHDRRAISRDPCRNRYGLGYVDVLVAGAYMFHPRGGRGPDEVRAELPRRTEDEQPLRGRHRPVIGEVYRSRPWTATPRSRRRAPHPTGAVPCAAS